MLAASTDEHNPSAEELKALLERVERIGVIGLSRFPEKAARRVPSYLAAKGYEIVPINPNADRILGKDVYDVDCASMSYTCHILVTIFKSNLIISKFTQIFREFNRL